ncbi:conserved hypothetical protein [Taylorella asinigenitalis 14/45]|uniref:Uncharacterized protein n=1 Tax=Taylorella asinigenitalis 14/45 TaxID=1091495 RepID=I7JS54_9BURK|nr:PP0621 family protein [Taylorella asinigenitalis]CCG20082.1 conserved hypothetical protein [Taylorella asinigenitalis 14/45]
MIRLLFFVLSLAIVFFFLVGAWGIFRQFNRSSQIARENRKRVEESYKTFDSEAPHASPENMIECDFCGLHTPESEIVKADGKHYCCDDHKRMALSQPKKEN